MATAQEGRKAGGVSPPVARHNAMRATTVRSRRSSRAIKATLEHALVGLIAETPDISGYDIVKLFKESTSHYWHAHPGQIYPTLERMEQAGLIRSREVIQRGRPNKRLFKITPQGQAMLLEWLRSPFEGLKLKHAPLLRCRFLGHLGADGAREKLLEERQGWEEYLNVYREIERIVFSHSSDYPNVNMMFAYFTLRRGIDWMEENIRWCDWAIGEIDKHHGLFEANADGAGCEITPARKRERRANLTN